jgi:hypothetical protein
MQVPLSSIATIQSGLVLSRKETNSDYDAIKYQRLSLRAFNSSGRVDHSELEDFLSRDPILMTHRTTPGDIVIRLFSPLFPTLITEDDAGFVIPSQLAVVRLWQDVPVMPEYLRYCLSRQAVADALSTTECGLQRSITVKTISNLNIPIVPIGVQKNIKQIFELSSQRAQLYQQLINQEQIQTENVIEAMIKGDLL